MPISKEEPRTYHRDENYAESHDYGSMKVGRLQLLNVLGKKGGYRVKTKQEWIENYQADF